MSGQAVAEDRIALVGVHGVAVVLESWGGVVAGAGAVEAERVLITQVCFGRTATESAAKGLLRIAPCHCFALASDTRAHTQASTHV